MKKTLLLLAAAIVAVSPLVAGNGDTAAKGNISAEIPAYAPAAKSDNKETKAKKGPWDRKKYINLGYIKQSLSPEFGNAFESKFGASFSSGRNIYLHKKPIANILKFAIDFGSEVNYAQYKDLIGDYTTLTTISDTPTKATTTMISATKMKRRIWILDCTI